MALQDRINANKHNSKELFAIVKEFARPNSETTDVPPSQDLCNKLCTFFHHKIRQIYDSFDTQDPPTTSTTTALNSATP